MKNFVKSISLILMASLMLSTMPSSVLADDNHDKPVFINGGGGSKEDDEFYHSEENQVLVSQSYKRLAGSNPLTRAISSKILNITGVKQETRYFCGPATTYIVLKFKTGSSVPQTALAISMGTDEYYGTDANEIVKQLNNRIGAGSYALYYTNDGAMNAQIENSIKNNFPVIYNVNISHLEGYLSYQEGGHYVVGYGYKFGWSGSLSYNDISYFDTYDSGYGSYGKHTITYLEMLDAVNANHMYYIAKS